MTSDSLTPSGMRTEGPWVVTVSGQVWRAKQKMGSLNTSRIHVAESPRVDGDETGHLCTVDHSLTLLMMTIWVVPSLGL